MDADVGTIFIYMPAFTGAGENPNPDLNAYVGTRGFRAYKYNDAVEEIPLPKSFAARKKRAAAAKEVDSRLVITNRPGHSAVTLCDSDTSRGPSLASLVEGMFCNMATRELQPVCAGELTENCFDVEKAKAASGQRVASTSASVAAEGTGYSSVIDWTT